MAPGWEIRTCCALPGKKEINSNKAATMDFTDFSGRKELLSHFIPVGV